MKQGWEIKKLGEVCDIICGQDYKAVKDDNGQYPIYGTGGIMGYASQYRCPANSIIIGRKGNINNPLYVECDFWNVDTAFGVVPNRDILIPKYFYLFCKNYDFTKHDVAVTIPSLRRTDIIKIPIPIPPLPEQEKIVSELDCLSGLIEKKRQQLKELDALAQSIFYEMFGNPVENERGWEVKKLGEVCSEIIDGDHMPPPKTDSGIPFITISNIDKDNRCIDFTNTFFVPIDYYNNIKPNRKVKKGDVLYTVTGSYGIPILVREDKDFCFQRHIGLLRPTDALIPIYLCYWALMPQTKQQADSIATGIAQKTVALSGLRKFMIILPPLPLQQTFAQKVEAIEKQKELIKQSIIEAETLLASRMQYYFEEG